MTTPAHSTDAAASPEKLPSYRWAMLGGVWFLYFSFGLTTASIAPLVGRISADLHISYGALGGIMGAWQFVYIFSAIPCGALLKRYGPRRMLLAAVAAIALSGVLRAVATGEISMFLAVAVFGIGGPMMSVGAPTVVALWFESRERPMAIGIYATGAALGEVSALAFTHSIVLPLFGDNWRACLLLYASVIIAAGLVWLLLTAHPASRAMEARLKDEPKRPEGQIMRDLLGLRTVQFILPMSIGIFFFNHGLNNWLPEILHASGMAPAVAGWWASIPTFVGIFASLLIPKFATPRRRVPILIVLFVVAFAASLLLHSPPGAPLGLGLILQGFARGSMTTLAMLILVETPGVGRENAGPASGLFFAAAEIGGVGGPFAIGVLHDLSGGFSMPLIAVSVVCVALILSGLVLVRHPKVKPG
ncbi:MAG: MFS transporter [Phenylobacterium sp.]|uniref:MFS transporter n=1 Tax=Phenylobacterium sp. TaxID=1871053 RepID=UPI0027354034|nr:MFS transporter [Phenylobacterium sp.]MDP3175100.1 MFS transporter [Phenylobacterium sp.]